MRALLYHAAHDVRVETVADPIIQEADDIILKVTATAICGSDLHLYRGKIPAMKSGDILGHEFMGVVVEVGPAVQRLKKGDRVVVPFVIACGQCFFCDQHLYAACETTNRFRSGYSSRRTITCRRSNPSLRTPHVVQTEGSLSSSAFTAVSQLCTTWS